MEEDAEVVTILTMRVPRELAGEVKRHTAVAGGDAVQVMRLIATARGDPMLIPRGRRAYGSRDRRRARHLRGIGQYPSRLPDMRRAVRWAPFGVRAEGAELPAFELTEPASRRYTRQRGDTKIALCALLSRASVDNGTGSEPPHGLRTHDDQGALTARVTLIRNVVVHAPLRSDDRAAPGVEDPTAAS